MPRPKKKPMWWRDPDTQAVVRRGLLYLIRNIYGEIPSSVKVRLEHKPENASNQDQNNKEESTRMRSNPGVEYCGACQEIYGKVYGNSGDLSTSDASPNTKTIPEGEISEISKGNTLGESVQDGSEISYFNDRKCLIKLLQQLYPEVANCLRQADHTSSVYLEDLCACLLAIYEAIETPDTENDLKCCLMQFIEQLYPDLISYIAKNTSNESVPMEEIEEEVVNENKTIDMVNDECKQKIFGDHVDETEQVGEFNTESTTEEPTSEPTITNDVETEDSHDNLDECLMELTQRICDELPNCVEEDALQFIESSEECDYEEEELLDANEEPDEKEAVDDYATYVAVAECFRNCLVELIPKLWPERSNCFNQGGDQTCKPTACIPTKTPKVKNHVKTCLSQPCPESPCCIKQSPKDHNSRKEENKEKCEIKCVQVAKESTCNVVDKSRKNDNDEMELNEAFLVKCVLQLIQQLCPELIDSDVKGRKPKGEIFKESVNRECRNNGGFAVTDKQKCERVQSETDLDGLNKCFAQLIQYLDNEIATSVDNSKNAESVECKIKETEGTKINFGKCSPCGEEIPAELIEEILVKFFLILVKQIYPEMVCCIMQSSGAKIDTDLKKTMRVGTEHEVQKLCEKEQNICGKHSDKLINTKECGKKSEWTEEALRKCLLEYVQQLIQELDNCTKESTVTTVTRTAYEKCGKENNDPAAEWSKEDIKELLGLVQKLCPELAECIRGCESDKISDSDQCDEEESTLSENDLIESLFQFMDQNNPKLYSCSDGSDTETECDEETMRNCFLKFVEELYPDLAIYTKQSLLEIPGNTAEISKADEECEMPQKVTQDVRECESIVIDENKTECIDNNVRECLVQFIQQISPELADCIKKYNDSNSAEADISDVSILEVSEALEASLSDDDIQGCLVKLIDLLCPDLAKYIRESDKSCKPCEPERNLVGISERSESASIEDSLRDSFISFIEEAYPEMVDCIKHIKKATNDDCNDGNGSEISEIDKDETTIDESIFDEVKTDETMNENNGEESQVEVLTRFDDEGELDHFDDEEKSEMTITPDQFTEDVQPESGEPDCRKNFDGEYEITVSYDADDNTEAQSVNLSQEFSSECIHPLTSINETQIDDEENLSSEDIFKDCFLRLLEQFDADLACCIMENLPENSSAQIKDSNESGNVISEQPDESQEYSENPSKVKFGLFEENTFMSDENITNEETSSPKYPMESQEVVEKTDDLVTDENSSMVSEVALVVNEDTSIEEGSALTEELSAAKIGELLNPEVLSSDFSQVEPSTNQNITISNTNILFEDERQATQQNFPNEISLEVKDSHINTIEQEEEEGTLFDSIFDEIVYITEKEESKRDVDSEMKREEGESITEESGDVIVEKGVPLSEYEESDGNVESPVVEENTGSEAEINERLYHEWIRCTSGMDIEPVKMNSDEDNEAKDMFSMEDGRTELMEYEKNQGNCGEWDELRVCLLAIADEFYPELANCIRKCLVEEEKGGMTSDFETDRRNMQLCLENFAAKFYAKPALKPEQDDSVPGVKNVEEIYTPTVKYIQQLILDFAQIFHPELARSLQQQ